MRKKKEKGRERDRKRERDKEIEKEKEKEKEKCVAMAHQQADLATWSTHRLLLCCLLPGRRTMIGTRGHYESA